LFSNALALDPTHAGAVGGKAMSLAQLGDTENAISLFRQAIDLQPDFAEFHRQLALCHVDLGDIETARRCTDRALQLDDTPDFRRNASIDIYNFGGSLMVKAAQFRDTNQRAEENECYLLAKGVFGLALHVDPNNPHAEEALSIVDSRLHAPSA
jgi:tetratricopeptide (TPR) repeat protein